MSSSSQRNRGDNFQYLKQTATACSFDWVVVGSRRRVYPSCERAILPASHGHIVSCLCRCWHFCEHRWSYLWSHCAVAVDGRKQVRSPNGPLWTNRRLFVGVCASNYLVWISLAFERHARLLMIFRFTTKMSRSAWSAWSLLPLFSFAIALSCFAAKSAGLTPVFSTPTFQYERNR